MNLILLLEAITGKPLEEALSAKWKRTPKNDIEKVENIALALKYLDVIMGMKLNINSQGMWKIRNQISLKLVLDLLEGNKKIIVSLLWRLISGGIVKASLETEATPAGTEAPKKEDPRAERSYH